MHKLTCGVDCAVCMERCTWNKKEPRKNVFWLSCQHGFHRDCITTWVASGHLSCPLCRATPSNLVILFSLEPEVFPYGTLITPCGATAWLALSHEVEGWEAELSKASDGARSLYSCAPTRQLEDDLQGAAYTASVQQPVFLSEAEDYQGEAEDYQGAAEDYRSAAEDYRGAAEDYRGAAEETASYDEAAAEAWLHEEDAYQAYVEDRLHEIAQERQEMQGDIEEHYHSQAESDDELYFADIVWEQGQEPSEASAAALLRHEN